LSGSATDPADRIATVRIVIKLSYTTTESHALRLDPPTQVGLTVV